MRNCPKPESTGPTLTEVLESAAHRLASVSPTARLDAEVLLAHVLGKSRTFLRTWPERILDAEQTHHYSELVACRAHGIPVAYLTGSREFWSRAFLVSPDVLIPRPETELLVELTLQAIAPLAQATVLDLATGSGAIAVTIAAECPRATVYASDVSESALGIARRNAERHGAGRVSFIRSDWFDGFPPRLLFDLIVSNPPYVPCEDPHLAEGDVRFEPHLALQAGADGLDAFRAIAWQARARLHPGGRLLLEHGYDQAEPLWTLLHQEGYRAIEQHADLQGHLRVTSAVWPGAE